MFKLLFRLALLFGIASAASAQLLTITGHVLDASGNPLASGTAYFTPVSCKTGVPISFQMSGGQVMQRAVPATVTGGVFTFPLPDVSQTFPSNVGFKETAQDPATGQQLIGSGYNCIQPIANSYWCGATSCNLDNYHPNTAPLALLQTGPQGLSGTVHVGSVSTISYGSTPTVTNGSSDPSNAVLNFGLPQGPPGNATTGPINISQLVGGPVVMPNGSGIVVMSDSIGLGLAATTDYMTLVVQNNPAFTGRVTLHKDAVSGSTLEQMSSRYAANDKAFCQAATAAAPVYFWLDGGTNSIGNANDTASTAYSVASGLLAQAKADGCTPIGATIRPRGQGSSLTSGQELQRELYNAMIRNTVPSTFTYWDVDLLLGNPNDGNFWYDGLHPNQNGHNKMSDSAAAKLLGRTERAPLGSVPASNFELDVSSPVVLPMFVGTVRCLAGASDVNLNSAAYEGAVIRIVNDGGSCSPYMQNGTDTFDNVAYANGLSRGPYLASRGDGLEIAFHRPSATAAGNWAIVSRSYAHPLNKLTGQSFANGSHEVVDLNGQAYYFNSGIYTVGEELEYFNSSSAAGAIHFNVPVYGSGFTGGSEVDLSQYQSIRVRWTGTYLQVVFFGH